MIFFLFRLLGKLIPVRVGFNPNRFKKDPGKSAARFLIVIGVILEGYAVN